MSANDRAKRRPRRIAADEAHSWARNLRLGNIQAKLVLSMLSLYVNGDGICWVSAGALAEDCELSDDTVRRRLAWLDQIGAVARVPQWIDENGSRNGDGKGRRTTDKIKLLYDADADDIEARAAGETVPEKPAISTEISLLQQRRLNEPEGPAGTGLASAQHPQCGGGLISEPEPEPESPQTPPGSKESDVQFESEPEDFGPAWQSWRGHEIMRRDLALAEFRLLSIEKQRLCRAAIPYFNALQATFKRDTVTNFHIWIRQKGFDEFPTATLGAAPGAVPDRRWVCGDELAGLMVALRMADRSTPALADHPEFGRGYWTTAGPRPDLAAMAKFQGDDPLSWPIADRGTGPCAAWRDRLKLWLGGEVEPRKVFLEPFDSKVHGLPHNHPDFKFRRSSAGLPAPAPWPPHRDGTWPENSGDSEVA
jgi:hypothetical protein